LTTTGHGRGTSLRTTLGPNDACGFSALNGAFVPLRGAAGRWRASICVILAIRAVISDRWWATVPGPSRP